MNRLLLSHLLVLLLSSSPLYTSGFFVSERRSNARRRPLPIPLTFSGVTVTDNARGGSTQQLSASVVDASTDSSSSPNRPPRADTTRRRKKPFQPTNRPTNRNIIRKLFSQAKDLERKGQWKKASDVLRDILVLDGKDAHSHLALARLEARRYPHTRQAVRRFEAGTAACPESVHLWQAWAVYEQDYNVQRARELYNQALTLEPYNPYVCHAFALMERKLGNLGPARELLERALAKHSTAALVCTLGELLIAAKEFEKARELYATHVVRLTREREKTEVYLAAAWLEERCFKRIDSAQELIERSLVSSPTSSVAQVALARLQGRRARDQHFTSSSPSFRKQNEHEGESPATTSRDATVQHLANTCRGIEDGTTSHKPADGRLYNAWANLEVRSRQFVSARNILMRGLDVYPADYSLWQAAGKVEERMGNYTGARDLYSASLRLQPSAPTLVAYAMLELRHPESGLRNLTMVKRLFDEALLLDPRHGPTYNAYARCVFEQEQDEVEARAILERGLRSKCPDVASIYHGYARLELALGNVNRARELLVEGSLAARRLDIGMDSPHRERALFLTHSLGMLELNSNRPVDALRVFADGIERYGNSSQLLLGVALCEVKLGNEQKARHHFELSVLNDERHAHAWQAWGVMEMRAGNTKTARRLFECGIKSSRRHGALWQAYASLEARLGQIDLARKLFAKGIQLSPKHVPLYQSWAAMEMREENYTAAKALITQALTRDKRVGSGWLIAARIEQHLGNHGLGNLLLRRGIECSPTNPELYCALGGSLVRLGKYNEAREVFEKGLSVDPMHAPLYHALAELEAQVLNVAGLAQLHKRAAAVFNTNALEPPSLSSETFGSRIKANRSRDLPKDVAALAERIVEEDVADDGSSNNIFAAESLLDSMSSTLLEDELVSELLQAEDQDA